MRRPERKEGLKGLRQAFDEGSQARGPIGGDLCRGLRFRSLGREVRQEIVFGAHLGRVRLLDDRGLGARLLVGIGDVDPAGDVDLRGRPHPVVR